MAVHIFWPPLAVLSMGVIIVAFIILKYGDKLCKARTIPHPQNFEIENQSSETAMYTVDDRTTYTVDDRSQGSYEAIHQMEIIPTSEKSEKYEYAV